MSILRFKTVSLSHPASCVILFVISAVFLSASSNLADSADTAPNHVVPPLAPAVTKALSAVRSVDWQALQTMIGKSLTISNTKRVDEPDQSSMRRQHIMPSDLAMTERKPSDDPPSVYATVELVIHRASKLSRRNAAVLREFGRKVDFTLSDNPEWLETGLAITSGEQPGLTGPAAQSRMISSTDWRVDFRLDGGRWVVSRLLVIGH